MFLQHTEDLAAAERGRMRGRDISSQPLATASGILAAITRYTADMSQPSRFPHSLQLHFSH